MEYRKKHFPLRKATMAKKRRLGRVGIRISGRWYTARDFFKAEKKAVEIIDEFRNQELSKPDRARCVGPARVGNMMSP